MQQPLGGMIGYAIRATDGDLGKVRGFYFDDVTWTIRYMVAETGTWLSGRKVLIGLVALGKPDWEAGTFSVNLTSSQVRNSPAIDTERPVYRQHEVELHAYYQWPTYWDGSYGGTFGITPYPLFENPPVQEPSEPAQQEDTHLRSTRQIIGYHIHANDGEIGHVTDFIVDEENWALTYMVVDTGNWLLERKVLIAVKWIKKVNWDDTGVYLDRSRESIKNSPDFDPSKTILRNYIGNP
ncbi:MAG: PRC-barrel domain-containing protein [Chitinispirillaceae bacterium]|nr:PRC-barrel domain-containing protein [Chitinispirillaceae bacterium]